MLELEITESVVMKDEAWAEQAMVMLKELGVQLAIDDFGTGYSSLSYLANFPINFVKIDKSFVDRVTLGTEASAVVRGILDLSRAMGFTCIAEGVEREDQRHTLDELGCEYLQGYLFGRPESATDASGRLTNLRHGIPPVLTGRS
jgi:EAL domain-containing protein (putative c-di-GMP-specific phosphodiesterase class I)